MAHLTLLIREPPLIAKCGSARSVEHLRGERADEYEIRVASKRLPHWPPLAKAATSSKLSQRSAYVSQALLELYFNRSL